MALALSILALLATFYQLYLQRVHNERSLKPLVQIDVYARDNLVAVRVQNNGLGPFIIEKLSFIKDAEIHHSIRKCISLNPQTYHNVAITDTIKKVILPNSYLDVFSVRLKEDDTREYIENIKQELAALRLKVAGRDIYNNRLTVERDLDWFLNYLDH